MSPAIPAAFHAHLQGATDRDETALRGAWHDDGVVEFPYAASVGSPVRLEGIDQIVDYFTGLPLFGPFTIGDVSAAPTADGRWFAEFRASSTVVASGLPYVQDYVVVLELADGRLRRWREYWDPTRLSGSQP